MIRILSILFALLASATSYGQDLYIRTFGKPSAPPLIFLHGGPGYNSAGFEATTAQKLADGGCFVIVYDRRGEGRSKPAAADTLFSFRQTLDDLAGICRKFGLKKVNLIGHSFGGIVGTLFAEKYPGRVNTLILVSAPLALQQTFRTILRSSRKIYEARNDSVNLKYIAMLEGMDTTSISYASYSFAHAMRNGFYSPKVMSDEAKAIYGALKKDSLARYTAQMSYAAPQGFWKQEHYTTLDLTKDLELLLAEKVKVYGLYGKDDGLYSSEQVMSIQRLLGTENLKYLEDCSHNVFMDQQAAFIRYVKQWIN